MRNTIKLPRIAETTDEVVVMNIELRSGDEVELGQTLMEVETDKAVVAVPSPVGGRVVEVLVAPGDEIATGTPIMIVSSD